MLIRSVTFLHAASPLWAHSVLHVLVVVCGQSISMRKNKPKKNKKIIQPCYEETLSLHVNHPETLNQPWMSFREGIRPRTILLPLFLKLFKLSFIFQNILRVNIRNESASSLTNDQSGNETCDVCLPVALSPCLGGCRFDTVCCFGTKITHTHDPVHVKGISSGYHRGFIPIPLYNRLDWTVYLQFCKHATKANFLRWSALEASSVGSFRSHASPVIFQDFSECT